MSDFGVWRSFTSLICWSWPLIYVIIMFWWTSTLHIYPFSPWLPRWDALKLNKQWCGLFGLRQASWHGCACAPFGFSSLWLATVNRSNQWQCGSGPEWKFLSGRKKRLGYSQGCLAWQPWLYPRTLLVSCLWVLSVWFIHTCTQTPSKFSLTQREAWEKNCAILGKQIKRMMFP